MSGSPIPIPTIGSTGITLPTYNNVLLGYQQSYQAIYGSDVSIEADDLDGQWLAVQAQAYFDLCQMIGVIYNSWGIITTTGAMLDNICALSDTTRQAATFSTAVVTITGTAFSPINNGSIGDNQNLGTVWDLPASITIPASGNIQVTATCTTAGAVTATPNSLSNILTPTAGWQTVTNAEAAIPGAAQETDAQLVQQQQLSVSTGSLTAMEAIAAAVGNVSGVTSVSYFNNDTDLTSNGVPPNSFAVIVGGGTVATVTAAIAATKPPGIPSFGNVSNVVFDSNGVPNLISYYELDEITINVQITINPLTGYQAQTGTSIQTAIAAYINALVSGEPSYLNNLFVPAKVNSTFVITNIQQGLVGQGLAPADLTPLIYQEFVTTASNVAIVVL